ncbi:hypothetical protein ACFL96_14930 [Thermoproteota archaeon]
MRRLVVITLVLTLVMFSSSAFASQKGSCMMASMMGSGKGSGSEDKGSASTATDKTIDKAGIQAVILQCINKEQCPATKTCKIKETNAEFDYLHSGVKEVDGLYVSCADFKAGDTTYDVDYYVKEEGGKYRVVKMVLHKENGQLVNEVMYDEALDGACCEKKGSSKEASDAPKGSGAKKGSAPSKGSGY